MEPKTNGSRERTIDINKIFAIIHKNFIVMTRDKVRIIPLMLFPIFMILVFGYTTGNIPKHIGTAVIAYDNSEISQAIQQEIANSQVFAVRYRVSTEGEARKLLDKGDIRVIIEIPPGLQNDIENGRQAGIVVIVDESDSAVASTAKQTMTAIVNKMSAAISQQKIGQFQASVSAASQILVSQAMRPEQYDVIEASTSSAQANLQTAKKLTDDQLKAVKAAAPAPLMFVVSSKTVMLNESNTYYDVPAGYYSTLAQIGLLQQQSALIGAAAKDVKKSVAVSTKSDNADKARNDYTVRKKAIAAPMKSIQVFTRYSKKGILQPLTYSEKPAYGTGKRPIDFVIPSIIALTIFQGALMGMGRAIAGEKREGSLTRVFLTPTSNATIIAGTLLFYMLFEMCRSSFLIIVSMFIFNIKIEGSLLAIGVVLFIYAGVSTGMGLIVSSIVRTEQQFMAVAMLFSMPSMFLSGALFPIQAMPQILQVVAKFLPVTYGGEALRGLMIKGFSISMVIFPIAILLVFLAIVLSIVFMVFTRNIE